MVRATLQTSVLGILNSSSMNTELCVCVLAGIVMYEVIGDKKLLDVGQSIYDYRSKISAFQQVDLSAVPYELQTLLGPMLLGPQPSPLQALSTSRSDPNTCTT